MQVFQCLIAMALGTAFALTSVAGVVAQPQASDQTDQSNRQLAKSSGSSKKVTIGNDLDHNSSQLLLAPSSRSLMINSAPAHSQGVTPVLRSSASASTPLEATSSKPNPTTSQSAQLDDNPGRVNPGSQTTPVAPATTQNLNNLNPNPNLLETPTNPSQVQIQTTQSITLQQALELARRNNRELQVAELELARTRSALREARAGLYPTFSVGADLTTQRLTSASTGLSTAVEASYDIYTSGRRSATIRSSKEQVRFNELEVERLAEQLSLDITNDYYDLQEANEQVRIAQAAVTNAEASLRDTQAQERAGLGTRFDVLRAQVQVANEQQALTESVSQQRASGRQLAQRLSLASTAGLSAADPVQLGTRWQRTLEESIVLAFQNRAELDQQLAQRNISSQQRRIALAELGPQLSLVASYDLQNFTNDNQGLTDGYSIGPRVNLNLFDGGAARARAAQEEANIAIAETNLADTRNQVRFDVEQAYFDLQSNLENTQTASGALDQARESLRLARLRFQAGVGTQTDVIAAETELTEAEGNRVQAILGYNRALASLQRAISNLATNS